MLVRVCVACGEEFRPDVLRCSDCGGELVARDDDASSKHAPARRVGSGAPEVPLSDARALAWSHDARDLIPVADALVAASLVFHIAPRQVAGEERARGYELQVCGADRGVAAKTVAPLVTPGSGVTLLADVVAQGSDATDELRCPACEAAVPPGADECAECGLGLAGEVEPAD